MRGFFEHLPVHLSVDKRKRNLFACFLNGEVGELRTFPERLIGKPAQVIGYLSMGVPS